MNSYRILERAEKYFQHDMIAAYTELPKFPHTRAELLYTFLQKAADIPVRLKELFPLVTTLMQVALDTHDMVDTHTRSKASGQFDRTTQLRVLAGDYFSSRFYQLLAQAGQVEWIKQLSASICDVNRMKVNLYMTMKQLKMTAEEYLRQSVQIKTRLFKTFTNILDVAYHLSWPTILDHFTRCEILNEELDRSESLDRFQDSWSYWCLMDIATADEREKLAAGELESGEIKQLLQQYGVKSRLQNLVEHCYKQLCDHIGMLQSEQLVQELKRMTSPLLQHQKV